MSKEKHFDQSQFVKACDTAGRRLLDRHGEAVFTIGAGRFGTLVLLELGLTDEEICKAFQESPKDVAELRAWPVRDGWI